MVSRGEYLYLLSCNLLVKWVHYSLYVLFWLLPLSNLLFELVFLNFHSLNLILVIKPHQLPWIFNRFNNTISLNFVYFKFWTYILTKFFDQVWILLLNKVATVYNAVKRSHLFVTIILLNGVLIHLIWQSLLVVNNVRNISKYDNKIFSIVFILTEILYIARSFTHCMLHFNLIIFICMLFFFLFFIIIRCMWINLFFLMDILLIFPFNLELSFFQISHVKFKAQLIDGHLVFKQSLDNIHKWYIFLDDIIIIILILKKCLFWNEVRRIYFIFKDNLVFIFKFIKGIQ